jgi:hypothetical protein
MFGAAGSANVNVFKEVCSRFNVSSSFIPTNESVGKTGNNFKINLD